MEPMESVIKMNQILSNQNLDDALEKLIYNTHLEYSLMSNLKLIKNDKSLNLELTCSHGLVRVTHTGSLTLKGHSIQPVFYTPESLKNFISAAELEDHVFRIVHVGGSNQIHKGEKIF